jgi:hypothetical protein
MLQPLQLQEVASRYSKEIAEVQDFLLKAGFTPGKASSLGTVTDRLRQDRTMRRDLTSHVWVVLHTSKASYAELLALVTLAAAGPHYAADADEDEAHDLLRFLMGARGEFEGAPARPVIVKPVVAVIPPTPLTVAVEPVPQPVAPVITMPVVAATPVAVPLAAPIVVPVPASVAVPVAPAPAVVPPVVEAPVAVAAAQPVVVAAPVAATPAPAPIVTGQPAPRARFTDTSMPGNLPPLRKQGDLPPLRWGSSGDSYYDSEPAPEGRMAIVAVIVCLLAVLLFGGAIWRYQYVQRRQAEVNQQRQQEFQQQQQNEQNSTANQASDGKTN